MSMINKKREKGFTLIELLVVVAIISLLSSVVLASLNSARMKARDAKRLSDMHQIQLALDLYYSKYGTYPNPSSEAVCGGWDSSADGIFIPGLETEGLLATSAIKDPSINISCYNYRYYRYGPQGSCTSPFYVLGINDMETSANPYPSSPGWSCTGVGARNWQAEFDWVVGKLE